MPEPIAAHPSALDLMVTLADSVDELVGVLAGYLSGDGTMDAPIAVASSALRDAAAALRSAHLEGTALGAAVGAEEERLEHVAAAAARVAAEPLLRLVHRGLGLAG